MYCSSISKGGSVFGAGMGLECLTPPAEFLLLLLLYNLNSHIYNATKSDTNTCYCTINYVELCVPLINYKSVSCIPLISESGLVNDFNNIVWLLLTAGIFTKQRHTHTHYTMNTCTKQISTKLMLAALSNSYTSIFRPDFIFQH